MMRYEYHQNNGMLSVFMVFVLWRLKIIRIDAKIDLVYKII